MSKEERVADRHGPVKTAVMQVGSGGSAGLVEICLMHPLDVVKTRFQVQDNTMLASADAAAQRQHYRSLFDCFRKIFLHEGPLGFYKGILPPILAETPKRATKFLSFEQSKRLLLEQSFLSLPDWSVFTLAGACSGFLEGFIINPFEVIKVRLQTDRSRQVAMSTAQMARHVVATGGFGRNGLGLGLTSTLMRHGVWNTCYFSIYHNLKHLLPRNQDDKPSLLGRFLLGTFSGFVASVTNIPFDVAKSRIQAQRDRSGKYRSCLQTIGLVYREEGFLALYKGLLPKLMRLAPGGGVMMIVFETVFDFLKRNL